MKNSSIGIGIVVTVVVIGGGIIFTRNHIGSSNSPTPTTSTNASANSSSNSQAVAITDFSFSNKDITVHVGDSVTWTNQDSVNHTVTSDASGPLNSGTLVQGASYSHIFTAAGTYPYRCSFHPDMTGSVTVE